MYTVLTVREGPSADGLVQDGHQEHVAVLKVRLHLVNRLNPEIHQCHVINKYIIVINTLLHSLSSKCHLLRSSFIFLTMCFCFFNLSLELKVNQIKSNK